MNENEFLETARKRLKGAVDADRHNRQAAIEDLRFCVGIDQWDNQDKQRRSQRRRPSLQINLLPKFVKQVTGDMRLNRPRLKVKPVDSKADHHIARIREGILNNIEYLSDAETIYDMAARMQVICGYGAWRVLTRYTEENPWLQEIYLEGIDNPFLVFLEPRKKPTDVDWAFILHKVPEDEFKELYPQAEVPGGDQLQFGPGLSWENWYERNNVTIAEYFIREKETQKMVQLVSGEVITEQEFGELLAQWQLKRQAADQAKAQIMQLYELQVQQQQTPVAAGGPQPQMAPPHLQLPPPPQVSDDVGPPPEIVNQRKLEKITIKQYKITASEILEGPQDFPGKYIPIVLIKGEETSIEGKPYVEGLVRQAKDPQRLFNYWMTAAAEVVALAPKAPWLVTAKQVEGYENDFAAAHIENMPYLVYNREDGSPPPQRNSLADVPVALFTQIQLAKENIRETIGMFNADVGNIGEEGQSGAAILARQRPGDISTFVYFDNLRKGIIYSGKVINEMIPKVYDSERDVRLRDVDDREAYTPINTLTGTALKLISEHPEKFSQMDKKKLQEAIREHGQGAKFNDITVGKYDVVIVVGPSYATQRQEASEAMLRIIQAYPQLMQIAGDLVVGNMDFKDSDKLAKRLEKVIPPGLREINPEEPPPAPVPSPPPTPQQQLQAQKAQTEQIKQHKEQIKTQVELIKLYKETKESEGEIRQEILKVLGELAASSAAPIY